MLFGPSHGDTNGQIRRKKMENQPRYVVDQGVNRLYSGLKLILSGMDACNSLVSVKNCREDFRRRSLR